VTLMPQVHSKRLPAVTSLLVIGATMLLAGCNSQDDTRPGADGASGGTCSEGGARGGETSVEETGCVGDGENMLCAPSGFPFVTRTFAVCAGSDCSGLPRSAEAPPNPTLSQPEVGTLCFSGIVAEHEEAGFPLILFTSSPDFGQIVEAFDANELGITDLSFTLDSVPEGGIMVDAGIVATDACSVPFDCLGVGFLLPRITQAGTVTVRLADFLQSDPARPHQDFDTSSLSHIGFTVGPGPSDFCLSDFEFLDASGAPVEPTAGANTLAGGCGPSNDNVPASSPGTTGGTGGAAGFTVDWGSLAVGRPCTADDTELAPGDGLVTSFMGDDGVTSRLVAFPSDSPSAPTLSTDDGALHITLNTPATSMAQYPAANLAFGSTRELARCLDASAFSGVEFSISGSVSGCTLQYATADVAHQDRDSRSVHATGPAGSYAPFAVIPVAELTAEPTLLKMPFVGGPSDGRPATPVDPRKLIFLTWIFPIDPAADDDPAACIVDISVDDVKFY
jgi:hypothetical protein